MILCIFAFIETLAASVAAGFLCKVRIGSFLFVAALREYLCTSTAAQEQLASDSSTSTTPGAKFAGI